MVATHIKQIIKNAKRAEQHEDFLQAIRLLHDAEAQARQAHIASEAIYELYDIYEKVLYQENDSLMEYLRNPDISIYERLSLLSSVKNLGTSQEGKASLRSIRETYPSTILPDIAETSELTREEKDDFFSYVERKLGSQYVSATQKSQLIRQIEEYATQAEQKWILKDYVNAFRLLDEAGNRSDLLGLSAEPDKIQVWSYNMSFADTLIYSVPSKILDTLRTSKTPLNEKQAVMEDLKRMIEQPASTALPSRFLGEEQDVIIQLFSSQELSSKKRIFLWRWLNDAVEKDMFKGLYDE